ncbi:immunoglobulin superfamily member 1-like isoform X2 [Engystomops pustulosus]|uniref:immunoglobulin superfamily member 1-like isoform X2 n=1 Tax=Engystomops pustulosus TaxID=76066 RepID=UPI003AFB04CC
MDTESFLLVSKLWASDIVLPKPMLKQVKEDPGYIMKGDTITLKCIKESGEVNMFYLVHEKPNGKNESQQQSTGEFLFRSIQKENNGDYFCRYCNQKACSEFSSPLNIFVHDIFPRPHINVSPQRIVHPGTTVTITCTTLYSNVEFSLFQNNTIFKNGNDGGNQFSYVISNASQGNVGFYSCMFKSKTNGMRSVRSNTMKISVLELPHPLMFWEEDPSDTKMLRINCTAPYNREYNRFLFTLLDGSKIIEEDVTAEDQTVIFSVPKPKYTTKQYRCLYRVKIDFDYADSLYSIEEIKAKGFLILIVRHILSALILILTGIILLLHFKDGRNSDEKPPDLPPVSARYKRKTKIVEFDVDE